MRRLLLTWAITLVAGQALAASEPAEPKPAPHLDLYPFAAPVIQNGRLVNYVFVNMRLQGASGAEATTLKRLEPQVRDALVRAAHRTSFAVDGTQLDAARLSAVSLSEGRRIGGAKTFTGAEVLKQTPQHRRVRTVAPRS